MSQFTDADTIRILVATDNHVGYEERDSIRKDDSWRTFDEIMTLARTQDVDMVLLAGDLFHENKPSRKAMYKVMRSLRNNCLGMKPCELQFLSDATEIFEGYFDHVNYEDPDINVSIPVFSIHGNHDDPSGDGSFCPLDILQVAGLVNYFGRMPEADNPKAKPVLLQKGLTKLALYGLSNIRDERMYKNFREHRVKWFRPNVQSSDWFNMVAVHQNHTAHTSTSYLPEEFLPEWLDMVVWGHEHECKLETPENPVTHFRVLQPGSSVATSLIPAEAQPKHAFILNVTGRGCEVEPLRLKTVRPFITREIKLSDDERFKGLDKKKDNRPEVTRRLMLVVDEMIDEANQEWLELQEEDIPENERPLPLVRLKVEHTPTEGGSYDLENPTRFSNRFAGKVANTKDVVYFYKKKSGPRQKDTYIKPELVQDPNQETIKMDQLVSQFLEHQSLKILPQAPFSDAVNEYVTKDDKHAMDTFVKETLTKQVKQMLSLGKDDDDVEVDVEAEMARIKSRMEKEFKPNGRKEKRKARILPRRDSWDSDLEGGHWKDQPEAIVYEDDDEEEDQPSERRQPAKSTRGRSKKAAQVVEDDEDEEMDDVIEEQEEEAPAPRPRGRGKAAAAKPAAASKAPAKKAPAKAPTKAPSKGRGRKAAFEEDSDEEEEDAFEEAAAPPAKRTTATRSQPARSQPSRAAPSQSQNRMKQSTLNFSQRAKPSQVMEISDDEISDDDDPFEPMPAKKTTTRKR